MVGRRVEKEEKKEGILKRMLKSNPNKKWHQSFSEAVVFLGFLAFLYLIVASFVSGEMNVKCRMNNIELRDVSPGNCYADFGRYTCPIPRDMECEVTGIPITLLVTRSD